MKKLVLTLLLSFGLIANAAAHHMSFNPEAGEGIPDISPHLEMVF